jgi:hypothetical protein
MDGELVFGVGVGVLDEPDVEDGELEHAATSRQTETAPTDGATILLNRVPARVVMT